jgi:hypothetical protein
MFNIEERSNFKGKGIQQFQEKSGRGLSSLDSRFLRHGLLHSPEYYGH